MKNEKNHEAVGALGEDFAGILNRPKEKVNLFQKNTMYKMTRFHK